MKAFVTCIGCFLIVLFSFSIVTAKGKFLIPYKKGNYWGISDEQGAMVLPAKYGSVKYDNAYVIAQDTTKQAHIIFFDLAGHPIDTCAYYIYLSADRVCMMNEVKTDAAERFKINDATSTFPFQLKLPWSRIKPPYAAHILLPNKTKKQLPGLMVAFASNNILAAIEVHNKVGVYDLDVDSFVIHPVFDSIKLIKPGMLLGMKGGDAPMLFDYTGKIYAFHPDPNALYVDQVSGNYVLRQKLIQSVKVDTESITIDKVTGKPIVKLRTRPASNAGYRTSGYALMSNEGKTLIPADRDWEYGRTSIDPQYIRMRKTFDSIKERQSVFEIADLNGSILITSAQEINPVSGGIYHILDVGPDKRDFYYNFDLKKIVEPENGKPVVMPNTQGFREVKKDGQRLFYNDKGDLLAAIADTTIYFHKEWNFLKKMSLIYDDTTARRTGKFENFFYAFRTSLNERFTIYDANYNKINADYEDLTPFVSSSKWVSFKKDGKWGLAGNTFNEVIPATYDKMMRSEAGYAIGELNGQKYWIDLHTMRRVNITGLDVFDESSFGDKHLGLKYVYQRPQPLVAPSSKVQTIYITDSVGTRMDSAVQNDIAPYKYAFTGNGNIVKYPSREFYDTPYAYIFKTVRDKPVKSRYYFGSAELCDGKVVLLQCRNEGGELGLLSADDFSIVVPFGKYDYFFTYPNTYAATDGSGKMIDVLLITGGTEEMHNAMNDRDRLLKQMRGQQVPTGDREAIGYYSLTGKKYWEK